MTIEDLAGRIERAFLQNHVLRPPLRRALENGQRLIPGQPIPDGVPMCSILNRELHPNVLSIRDRDKEPIIVNAPGTRIIIEQPGKSGNLLHSTDVEQVIQLAYKRPAQLGDALYVYTQEVLVKNGLHAIFAPLPDKPHHIRIVPVDGIYDETGDIHLVRRQGLINAFRTDRRVNCIHHVS